MRKETFFYLASTLALAQFSPGAVITWGSSVAIDDAGSFVDTTGTLVAAINADNAADNATIGGVTFVGNDLASWNAGIAGVGGVTITSDATEGNFGSTFIQGGGNPPGITDSNITNLVGSALWNPQSVELTGLTIGDTYTIQIIGNDSRNGRSSDFVTVLSDGVNTVADSLTGGTAGLNSLSDTPPTGADPRDPGHAIVGTFVADAATQEFELAGSNNGGTSLNSGGRAQINGFQLRVSPVPEPSSALLLGLASAAFFVRRRK